MVSPVSTAAGLAGPVAGSARTTASRRSGRAWRAPGTSSVVDVDDVTVAEPLLAEPVGRGRARGPAAPATVGEARAPSLWSGWPWVSSTTATGADRPCVGGLAAAATAARWPACSGPGSTTTARPPGAASSQVLVPSRVIGPGLGASTRRRPSGIRSAHGRRTPRRPAGSSRTCSSSPSPVTTMRGRTASICRPAAGGQDVGDRAVRRQLGQRRGGRRQHARGRPGAGGRERGVGAAHTTVSASPPTGRGCAGRPAGRRRRSGCRSAWARPPG